MRNIEEASRVLNYLDPPGERLAYLNPEEEAQLKQMSGAEQE